MKKDEKMMNFQIVEFASWVDEEKLKRIIENGLDSWFNRIGIDVIEVVTFFPKTYLESIDMTRCMVTAVGDLRGVKGKWVAYAYIESTKEFVMTISDLSDFSFAKKSKSTSRATHD